MRCRLSTMVLRTTTWVWTCCAEPVDEGVTDVVLTPYYRPDDDTQRSSQLQHRYDEFTATVADADIGVSLHLGAELGFRFGLAQLAHATPVARLAGGCYVLVDLPPGRCHRG